MVLLDTNIFIIDRFFPRDVHYNINRQFILRLSQTDAGFSIFSLLELCGLASFNLASSELKRWSYQLGEVYDIQILDPYTADGVLQFEWFKEFTQDIFKMFERKMTFGDALLLQTAEDYQVETIITWNKKHFEDRTSIPVLTPEEYLALPTV